MRSGDEDETIFNMVSAMLLRIHQSGHLAELSPKRLALVQEGIALHRAIVEELKDGLPFWPLGLGQFGDEWLCLGIACGETDYMAVWHTTADKGECTIPVDACAQAEIIYPKAAPKCVSMQDGCVHIALDGIQARLLKLDRR